MADQSGSKLTPLGVLASLVMILGLVAVGAYVAWSRMGPAPAPLPAPGGSNPGGPAAAGQPIPGLSDLKLIAPEPVPTLAAPAAYVMKNGVLDIELSKYAGYAGIIAANGGLEPNPESLFAKKFGFQARIRLSEDEGWDRLNTGQVGVTATTADVLAVFGRQFSAVVPVQLGFSRGADGIVVGTAIRRINDLKGKVVVTTQHTEAEFFIRFLAQEAGAPVSVLDDLSAAPKADAINLVFAEDGEQAGAVYASDLKSASPRLAGCVTWDPTTTEVVQGSGGKARLLVTNRNLLVIADVLAVNRGFAEQNPAVIAGLVEGVLEGNRLVRDQLDAVLPTLTKAFGWDAAQARRGLAKVHFSNLPENLAFFAGTIDMAGSFGGIYQSSVLAYGTGVIPNPTSSERFLDLTAIKALEASGRFKDEKVVIAPIRTEGVGSLESDPLLSKDIRFFFEPNSANLDMKSKDNLDNLEVIRKMLRVSPGSRVLLRGHVDNAKIEEFRRLGGESLVRKNAMEAMALSQRRADEIRRILTEQGVDAKRLETVGRGWEEPAGTDMDKNRRVEVYWYTLE
jgi:NitT/TauT family transport system substrate-binding protein